MIFKFIFGVINKFLSLIATILKATLLLFPPSPFNLVLNSQFSELLGKINVFIPVFEIIAVLEAYLVAVTAFYLYSAIARWVKMIR